MTHKRTFFVYVNEKLHLFQHDARKRLWLDLWMHRRFPNTSANSPPPFGLYPIAMTTHYGIKGRNDICVWQVSQWDDRDTAAKPLELKHRSPAEQQCCLDAVYEWVEGHLFEQFKHEGLRGSPKHMVKVNDMPLGAHETSRSWAAHYQRFRWVTEEWAGLALKLGRTGGEQTNQDKNHNQNQPQQNVQNQDTEQDKNQSEQNRQEQTNQTASNETSGCDTEERLPDPKEQSNQPAEPRTLSGCNIVEPEQLNGGQSQSQDQSEQNGQSQQAKEDQQQSEQSDQTKDAEPSRASSGDIQELGQPEENRSRPEQNDQTTRVAGNSSRTGIGDIESEPSDPNKDAEPSRPSCGEIEDPQQANQDHNQSEPNSQPQNAKTSKARAQSQPEKSVQAQEPETRSASGGEMEERLPDTRVQPTKMIPEPLQPTYNLPSAPPPSVYLPPTMDGPAPAGIPSPVAPVTLGPIPVVREPLPPAHPNAAGLAPAAGLSSTPTTNAGARPASAFTPGPRVSEVSRWEGVPMGEEVVELSMGDQIIWERIPQSGMLVDICLSELGS